MKSCRMIWLAAILLMAGAEAVAQNRGEREGRRKPSVEEIAQHQTTRMTEALGLSPEQAEQVGVLNRQQAEKRQAHQEAMRQEREAHKQALRSVLSPEQYARWEQIESERRENRPPAMRGDSAHRRGEGCSKGDGCCRKPQPRGERRAGAPAPRR